MRPGKLNAISLNLKIGQTELIVSRAIKHHIDLMRRAVTISKVSASCFATGRSFITLGYIIRSS